MSYYLGIDFGTTSARAVIINQDREILFSYTTSPFPSQSPQHWQDALFSILSHLPPFLAKNLQAIALDATSSTMLLSGEDGVICAPVLWYSDGRGQKYLEEIARIAPEESIVVSATSSFAKVYWWYREGFLGEGFHVLHQADWLAYLLHGNLGVSDYHNALKLGYDPAIEDYPRWLQDLPFFSSLPQVKTPGEAVAPVLPSISRQFGINPHCLVKAGTTDSIAAFLASGANKPGEAVTSLGSTLVLKLLSTRRVDDARYGIYSHRLGDLWLAGGASNTGGAVLTHFFSLDEIVSLSQQIDPSIPSPLQYYPLLSKGERFPINNPHLEPKISPRPDNPVQFLHALLEGIAAIEAMGYQLLVQLGANPLSLVYTAGGGAHNPTWLAIRQRHLKVPVFPSPNTSAAFGSALLASL